MPQNRQTEIKKDRQKTQTKCNCTKRNLCINELRDIKEATTVKILITN
jgi:hypothetical protein